MAGTYSQLYYHVVFSTKHRHPLITTEIDEQLHRYIAGIILGIGGIAIETNGMPDHVHILMVLPPRIAVSDAVRTIKANSSKWIHETDGNMSSFGWQDGFAAFTVSRSQFEPVRRYIREQKEHHRQRDYHEELRFLLERHGVAFDERYLLD